MSQSISQTLKELAELKGMSEFEILEDVLAAELENARDCIDDGLEYPVKPADTPLHDSIMNSPEIMEIRNKIEECDNQIQYIEKIKESHEDGLARIFEAQYKRQEKMLVAV